MIRFHDLEAFFFWRWVGGDTQIESSMNAENVSNEYKFVREKGIATWMLQQFDLVHVVLAIKWSL